MEFIKAEFKVHIQVCQKKCKLVQECKTYKEFVNNLEKKVDFIFGGGAGIRTPVTGVKGETRRYLSHLYYDKYLISFIIETPPGRLPKSRTIWPLEPTGIPRSVKRFPHVQSVLP
jgi:hypothetical protein